MELPTTGTDLILTPRGGPELLSIVCWPDLVVRFVGDRRSVTFSKVVSEQPGLRRVPVRDRGSANPHHSGCRTKKGAASTRTGCSCFFGLKDLCFYGSSHLPTDVTDVSSVSTFVTIISKNIVALRSSVGSILNRLLGLQSQWPPSTGWLGMIPPVSVAFWF
jgi:hypothetical protein